jgi:protein-S-isoprenylcysteine O-methyltransferase Ste14
MTFLGFGMTFSNVWSVLVLTLPMTAVFLYRIKVEEQALLKFFSDDYVRYRQGTKRLLPWVY